MEATMAAQKTDKALQPSKKRLKRTFPSEGGTFLRQKDGSVVPAIRQQDGSVVPAPAPAQAKPADTAVPASTAKADGK
jgi:hypothetical protein